MSSCEPERRLARRRLRVHLDAVRLQQPIELVPVRELRHLGLEIRGRSRLRVRIAHGLLEGALDRRPLGADRGDIALAHLSHERRLVRNLHARLRGGRGDQGDDDVVEHQGEEEGADRAAVKPEPRRRLPLVAFSPAVRTRTIVVAHTHLLLASISRETRRRTCHAAATPGRSLPRSLTEAGRARTRLVVCTVPGGRATGRADTTSLRDEHTTAAVRRRLAEKRSPSYLQDFIYGAIDGTVTTFAVVAGVEGANLDEAIVVILGGANLIADGFSMAASNFLGTRAERQQRARARHAEERHVDALPEGEREEVQQIFAAKGFDGDELRARSRRDHGKPRALGRHDDDRRARPQPDGSERVPRRLRDVLFAFVTVGFLPLLVFVYERQLPARWATSSRWSAVMTAAAFVVVGAVKSRFVDQPWWRSALETLAVGNRCARLRRGCTAAAAGLTGTSGVDPSQWQWGGSRGA